MPIQKLDSHNRMSDGVLRAAAWARAAEVAEQAMAAHAAAQAADEEAPEPEVATHVVKADSTPSKDDEAQHEAQRDMDDFAAAEAQAKATAEAAMAAEAAAAVEAKAAAEASAAAAAEA